MRRQPLSYVLWCLGGTALYLWGAHHLTHYVEMRWPETGTAWLFLFGMPAILVTAVLMDRNQTRKNAEAGIITAVSVDRQKAHRRIAIVCGLVLSLLWVVSFVRVV